jgi:outer membrane protein assembly factor BamB
MIPAGDKARVRWIVPLDKPFPVPDGHDMHRAEWLDRPTAPVTAGGLAIHGCSDGSVRAVRIEDGQPGWTFWTGGPVLTSPAVANGRVYVGSGDGWVYCLDSNSGELIWKWRGASVDRRISIYGKLTSLWPVTAVVVDRGKVFGVAGQAMQNGSVAFAIDAVTGKVDWTTWTEPACDGRGFLQSDNQGFGPAGQLAVLRDRLWVRTYHGMPAIFDMKSGQRVPASDELVKLQKANSWGFGVRISTSGQDMVVVDDQLVLQGGYPLLGNPDIRHDKTAARFIAYYVDDAGRVDSTPLPRTAIPGSQIAPSMDNRQILIVGGVGRSWRSEKSTVGLSLWSLDDWRREFENGAVEPGVSGEDTADPAPSTRRSAAAANLREGFCLALDMKRSLWHVSDADVNGVILCRDAAVAVVGERKRSGSRRYGMQPSFEKWKLIAFDRATGKARWNVDLPGEPVFNGLAPSGEGAWLLTLRDGSVVAVGQ